MLTKEEAQRIETKIDIHGYGEGLFRTFRLDITDEKFLELREKFLTSLDELNAYIALCKKDGE